MRLVFVFSSPTRKVDAGGWVGLYRYVCGWSTSLVEFCEGTSSVVIRSVSDFIIVDIWAA